MVDKRLPAMKVVSCTQCGIEVTEDKLDFIDTPKGCDIVCKDQDSCPNWQSMAATFEQDAEDQHYLEGGYAGLQNPYGR